MSQKITTITQLKKALESVKQYVAATVKELEEKISSFHVSDKSTGKTYTLEMDNGLFYLDDGEE